MRFGLDLLGGAKYKKEAINNLPAGWALGIFAEAFGDAHPVVEAALKKGCPHVRVQLLWSDSHSFGDGDIPKIKKLSKRYNDLAVAYPGAIIELSPFCEHNIKNPDKYLDIVKASAPSCRPVNTPMKGGLSQKYKNEVHHGKPVKGPYNFSYDGASCVDADVEKDKATHSAAGCEVFFLWWPRFNLKWSMKDPTPRPQRTALPTKNDIRSIVYLAGSKGKTSVPKGWLVKSHAEKHNAADSKGDKLLIIATHNAHEIKLRRNGQLIDTLKYYGPYDGGGWRYYSRKMGYENGADLEIWIGSKKYGVCNGGFRDPTYR